MPKLKESVNVFVQDAFAGKKGGISLQGVTAVHRHPTNRRLTFSVAIEVGFYNTDDVNLAGRAVRFTDMSDSPEELGHRTMDMVTMIESFTRVRSRTREVLDFLGQLGGVLFDAQLRLSERSERNRLRKVNRAIVEWTRDREELELVGTDHTFAPVSEESPAAVGT